MSGVERKSCLALALWLSWLAVSARAADTSPIVVNEASMTPQSPALKFLELYNRGPDPVDLHDWWICDQPTASIYMRLLQVPTFPGQPAAGPGIVLGPGDFLVIHFGGPSGNYMTRANGSGTTTHQVVMGIPASLILVSSATNISIWDESGLGDDPTFDLPLKIRDLAAWSTTGVFVGRNRTCVASDPLAGLWPPPIVGDCVNAVPTPEFVAVNSSSLLPMSNLSINYNGRSANDPSDYFIALATEGERNVMPGDLDDDLDMDNDDAALFPGCLNQPADPPICSRADLDLSGTVDCLDWPIFLEKWALYATLPIPELPPCEGCTRGDLNSDGFIDGLDAQGLSDALCMEVVTGRDVNACAADVNTDGMVDCLDVAAFSLLVLELAGPQPCLGGDMNADGLTDGLDIQPFLAAILAPACLEAQAACNADANHDDRVDLDDVGPFVVLLLGPPPPPAPRVIPLIKSAALHGAP